MRVVAATVVALALVAGSASAEDWTRRHENTLSVAQIDTVGWMGVFVSGGEPTCQLDAERLFRSAKFVLTTAHITVLDGEEYMKLHPLPPMLSVVGDMLKMSNGGCAINFEIRITDQLVGDARIRATGQQYGGSVELWSDGSIGVDNPSKLPASIAGLVEDAMKQFVIDRADDQKRLDSMGANEKAYLFQLPQQ